MPFWRVEHFWGDTAHLCSCGSSLHPPQQQLDKPPPASHTQAPAQGWTLPSSQLCFDPLMDSPKPKGACPLRPSQSPRPTAQVVSWPHKKHNPLLPYHSVRRAGLRVEWHGGPHAEGLQRHTEMPGCTSVDETVTGCVFCFVLHVQF